MRYFALVIVSAFFASVLTYLVTDRARATQPPGTAVVADEESGVIRFYVEGQERAVLDAAGLHVNGDVTFTGVFIDTGHTQAREAPDAP